MFEEIGNESAERADDVVDSHGFLCEIERKRDLSVKGKERILLFAVSDFVIKSLGGGVAVCNRHIVFVTALEKSNHVEIGRARKLRFCVSEVESDFGLEHAVFVLQAFNSVRVEVGVDVAVDAVEFAVLNVRFQIQRHARKRAEFAKIETKHVFDKPDDVFGDKTLNKRNYADDKSEIAGDLQHGVTVAVVHELASGRAEQDVDDELFDGERNDVHVDKALQKSADVITHQGVEKHGRKVELFKTFRQSRHKGRHVDVVRPYDVNACVFLDAAQIGHELAFIVVSAEQKFALTACRHCANGLVVHLFARKLRRLELSEFDKQLTRVAFRFCESVDSAGKTHGDESVVRVFVETEHECRVKVYVSRIFLVPCRRKCCVFEHLPSLLRTERLRFVNAGSGRRCRNNRVGC